MVYCYNFYFVVFAGEPKDAFQEVLPEAEQTQAMPDDNASHEEPHDNDDEPHDSDDDGVPPGEHPASPMYAEPAGPPPPPSPARTFRFWRRTTPLMSTGGNGIRKLMRANGQMAWIQKLMLGMPIKSLWKMPRRVTTIVVILFRQLFHQPLWIVLKLQMWFAFLTLKTQPRPLETLTPFWMQ